jgi:hypothetical protein
MLFNIHVIPSMWYPLRSFARLHCSLPTVLPDAVLDILRSPSCATFAGLATTLPMWKQDLLGHAMKKPLATPLYGLLLQTTLVGVSGGVALTIMAPSVGCFALTTKSYRNAKASPEVTQRIPIELKGMYNVAQSGNPELVSDRPRKRSR